MSEPSNRPNRDHNGFLAGAILGALAAGVAALLLTPKNGKEMRQSLQQQTNDLKDGVEDFKNETKKAIAAKDKPPTQQSPSEKP